MNSDFEELYQQVILDHSKRPRNYGLLEGEAVHVHGDNPSCGDEIQLHVRFGVDGAVEDIRFTGLRESTMILRGKSKWNRQCDALLAEITAFLNLAGTQRIGV